MILIVEDFEPQRFVRKRILEDAGYTVREAGTIEQARRMVARQVPQLVLTDVGLPDGNGVNLCVELKREYPGLPVVMVTESFRGDQCRRDAIGAGADAFLSEPVPRDQLLRVIAQVGRFEPPAN